MRYTFFRCLAIIMITFEVMMISSCRFTVNAQIDAFEESITLLENNYKDLTPSELENAINICENQLNALNNIDTELTPNQKSRISHLTGHYHHIFEGTNILQYLKGLLSRCEHQ